MKLFNARVFGLSVASVVGTVALVWQVTAFGLGDVAKWMGLGDLSNLPNPTMLDTSNDEAFHLSSHQLIERAGFKCENHTALADDGYITQLIRIINPLADRSRLKWPPIILQHGQTANSKNFIMQSNKQHHPMRWPPRAGLDMDKLFQEPSSNRSLAFMLANNGYDVWLTSTRGVDENNRGYLGTRPIKTIAKGKINHKNMTRGESKLLLSRIKRNYWSFTLDDQIAQELPAQIAVVLNVTGAEKVTLFGYSNTALTTFAMLSIRQDISPYVDSFIASAPVVFYNRLEGWFKWFMDEFMQLFPKDYDVQLFLTHKLADFVRRVTMRACTPLPIRYTICKSFLDLLFGESGQFTTNLELPMFAHLLRATSWKCLAQHLQIVRSRKLEKFNYGPFLNRHYYGGWAPPEYDLTRIAKHVKVVLISGDKDCWANQATLDEVRAKLPSKVALDLVVENYNHLDLAAAFDVDQKVNLPLLRWLDNRHQQLKAERDNPTEGGEAEKSDSEEQDDGPPQKSDLLDPFALLNIDPNSIQLPIPLPMSL